jgi:alginate O-acetyltransferase complex protein AlgI
MSDFARMLLLIGATFALMKVVVARVSGATLSPGQWAAFAAWPGMRPAIFTRLGQAPSSGAVAILAGGLRNAAAGALLLVIARSVNASAVAATLIALPALSLILHFGLFDIATAFWRWRGVPAEKLFRAPLAARTLGEFWSRRWNLAFSQMLAIAVDRPLRSHLGRGGARMAAFLASGLLHEIAISLPVHAGYGLPTSYFLLQGLFVTLERQPGRPRTLACLILPLPLLFHPPFVRGVIWPLIGLG